MFCVGYGSVNGYVPGGNVSGVAWMAAPDYIF